MSDFALHLVGPSLDADAAREAARIAKRFFVENGYFRDELTDCVLSKTGLGHPPGPSYEEIFVDGGGDPRTLLTNGLSIETSTELRLVAGVQYEPEPAVLCPRCRSTVDLGNRVETMLANKEAPYTCEHCRERSLAAGYETRGLAFSHLVITIWNNTQIKPEILEKLAGAVGCRLETIRAKV